MNTPKHTSKKTLLLLVDDNPLLTGVYKTAFERADFEVVVAHNGERGIQIAKDKRPDAILLDLLMPGLSGFEILIQLKLDDATKDIQAIVLTAGGKEEDLEKAKRLGAFDCIVKSETGVAETVDRVRAIVMK